MQVVVDARADRDLVDVLDLAVEDVRLERRGEQRLPDVGGVEVLVALEAVVERPRLEVLRVKEDGHVARGDRRQDDVVDRADAEDLELALDESALHADGDVLAELARHRPVEPNGALRHLLVRRDEAQVRAAVRDLPAPARQVVVPGGDPVGELLVATAGVQAAVRRVVVAVADVEAAAALAGLLGDDVDDAVERVGAVERRARTADDLDALDVLRADRERLPERGADEVDVHAAAVDEDEHLVGEALVEAAERDLGWPTRWSP